MMVGGRSHASAGAKRPWTFYVLASLFGFYLLFLYGPMLVIYLLSFQGSNGGVTFPMVGFSFDWFADLVKPGQMANIPASLQRSLSLAAVVSAITVVVSVAAGLGFRRRFRGSGVLFYLAVASLVMPSLLVGFGIGLGFKGALSVRLDVRFLESDTHSAATAVVPSAAWRLVEVLSSLRGRDGKVRIPGFYDPVRAPTEAERRAIAEQGDSL